ncbi:hypothetical protein WI604_25775 [Bradyrhizobium symbiodeficiens]|uniref:hypothetical protein n=1 Tax=Bradyrhizobium symbiodeficiens TaxID=1404367 RepID=UPI0030D3C569
MTTDIGSAKRETHHGKYDEMLHIVTESGYGTIIRGHDSHQHQPKGKKTTH